tara:strand:+ start:561 stop:1118 length:558 start_codon:yes stop_codon:yes gene_type:complete
LSALIIGETIVYAAEAGMPQLDPRYWFSQAFWLLITFTVLYILVSKLFIPKIKNNIDDRERKIKDDLEKANSSKQSSEIKEREYTELILNSKKEVAKMMHESKKRLEKDMQQKKLSIEKQINDEIDKTKNEIMLLKRNSIPSIEKISEEITSKLIQEITGDNLNQSSIRAIVSDVTKKKLGKSLS